MEALRLLLFLRAILRAPLHPFADTLGVERAANDMIAYSWKVLHAPAANQYNRVLLKVVPLTRNVCSNLDLVRQANTSHFAKS